MRLVAFLFVAAVSTKAIAQMAVPAALQITPTLDLNFLTMSSLPSTLTFSRASTAYYINSGGSLAVAASGVPRFEYDPVTLQPRGLLMEPAATNLVPWSVLQGGGQWYTVGATSGTNATAAPDGTITATKVTEASGAGTNQHILAWNDNTAQIGNNGVFTGSMYFKAGNRSAVAIYTNDHANTNSTIICTLSGPGNCTPGVNDNNLNGVITDYGIRALANGWYRAYWVFTSKSGGAVINVQPRIRNDAGLTDWYDAGAGGGYIYQWGLQIEAGTTATSYIPTTGAAASRAADTLTANSMSWFSNNTGTLYAQYMNAGGDVSSTYRTFGLFGTNAVGTFSQNEISLADTGTSTSSKVTSGGTAQFSPVGAINGAGYVTSAALAYTSGSLGYSTNGTIGSSQTSGSSPATQPTFAYIGSQPDGNQRARWIQKIQYYNQRLNNQLLGTMTNYSSTTAPVPRLISTAYFSNSSGTTYASTGMTGTNFSISTSGVNAGDLLILVATADGHGFPTPIYSGFTHTTHTDYGNDGQTMMVAWKFATASEPANYTGTWANANPSVALALIAVTGANASNPLGVISHNFPTGSGTSPSTGAAPSIITPVNNCTLIYSGHPDWQSGPSSNTFGTPTGFTNLAQIGDRGGLNWDWGSLQVAYKTQAVAGSSGAVSGTATAANSALALSATSLLAICP